MNSIWKILDTYLIYCNCFFEAIDVISWGAFSTYVSTHSISLSQAGKPIYGKKRILLTSMTLYNIYGMF